MECYYCKTKLEWKEGSVYNDVKCPKCGHSFRLIDTLDRLMNIGYRAFEIKIKSNRMRSCWVSPNGEWFNVPFGDHTIFAFYVVKERYPSKLENEHFDDSCSPKLLKVGWIFFHHDVASGTIFHLKHMNEKQYKVLYDFFGDERLFRGWTIKDLWGQYRGD